MSTQLDTATGLYAFLTRPITRPEILTVDQYKAMSAPERSTYNETRLRFLAQYLVIGTTAMDQTYKKIALTHRFNRLKDAGRNAVVISGYPATGKTTAINFAMIQLFKDYDDHSPTESRRTHFPIVYVNIPSGTTAKGILMRIADFFNAGNLARLTHQQAERAVVELLEKAGTQFLILDELHNLAGRSQQDKTAVGVIKDLTNSTSTTVVLIGANLDEGHLLEGTLGAQIRERSDMIKFDRYTHSTKQGQEEWHELVLAMAHALPLIGHDPSLLAQHSTLLFERTKGSIGALHRILTRAALAVIDAHEAAPGIEQIRTKHLR